MRDVDELFAALDRSKFRRRFRLAPSERAYLQFKGLPTVLEHARDFIEKRLSPAMPPNDGRQTPLRGHPAFIAQHATATCCRSCLARWHGIEKGIDLTSEQIDYILAVLEAWLTRESSRSSPATGARQEREQKPDFGQQTLF
jgi:hypothetical protein